MTAMHLSMPRTSPTQDGEAEGNGRSEKKGLLYQHRSQIKKNNTKTYTNKSHFGMAFDMDMFGFVLSLLPNPNPHFYS